MVIAGVARGPVLRVPEPLSFWGGVDPRTGRITDPQSSRCGQSMQGRVLMLAETRGSSSSSAVMLELIASKLAPAAVVLGRIDAILGLGIIVAQEMGYGTLPLLVLPADQQAIFADGAMVAVDSSGAITALPE